MPLDGQFEEREQGRNVESFEARGCIKKAEGECGSIRSCESRERSREDNYHDAMPTRQYPLLSMDYMFSAIEKREQPLATHLVVVDAQ